MRCFWEDAGASGPFGLRGVHSDVCILAAREATPAPRVVQLTGGEGHLHESSCPGLGSNHDGAAIFAEHCSTLACNRSGRSAKVLLLVLAPPDQVVVVVVVMVAPEEVVVVVVAVVLLFHWT